MRCRRGRQLIESPRGLAQLAARDGEVCIVVSRSRDADMLAVAAESYTRASLMHAPVNLLYPSRFPGNPHVVVVITNYTTDYTNISWTCKGFELTESVKICELGIWLISCMAYAARRNINGEFPVGDYCHIPVPVKAHGQHFFSIPVPARGFNPRGDPHLRP